MIRKIQRMIQFKSGKHIWLLAMVCGAALLLAMLTLMGCPVIDWFKNYITQTFAGICKWIEDRKNANYIEIMGIIVSLVTLLGVAVLTVKATTYVYNMQKEDEKRQIQDELHLILNEMGKNIKTLQVLAGAVHIFDEESQRKISNRDAIRKAVGLWRMFDFIRQDEDYLANYHKFYHIFAKEEEVEFRTGDKVRLSDLEEKMSYLQLQIERQFYAALELKRKMNTLQNLFEEIPRQRMGKTQHGLGVGHLFHEKNKGAEMDIDNSAVKRIDRTLRNEGMDVDILSDMTLNEVRFTYNDKNSFQKDMISFERTADNLISEIQDCTMFPQKVREKYFI